MPKYNPYAGQKEPDDITLEEYAESWVDMVDHVDQLKDLASQVKTIVEFGLRGGVSTWAMLDGLPEDGNLIGVDIDPDALISRRVREDPRFTFIIGDSINVDLPKKVDLVMIDSSHEYEQTIQELLTTEKMHPRFIVLHDYYYREDDCRVQEAVDGFVAYRSYRVEVIHPSRWGLAILVEK